MIKMIKIDGWMDKENSNTNFSSSSLLFPISSFKQVDELNDHVVIHFHHYLYSSLNARLCTFSYNSLIHKMNTNILFLFALCISIADAYSYSDKCYRFDKNSSDQRSLCLVMDHA